MKNAGKIPGFENVVSGQGENIFSIREQIVLAFPGNYGLFLALHFGRYLDEPIDTELKHQAYNTIIAFLDNVPLTIDDDLQSFMESILVSNNTTMIEQQAHDFMSDALRNTENFLENHQHEIEQYIEYKLSVEFKTSPVGKMQEKVLEFQKANGYQKLFIGNLKVLSASYRDYLAALDKANKEIIRKFPKSKDIYER